MFKHIYTLVKRRIKRRLLVAIYRKPKVVRASTQEKAQHYIENYGWPTTRCYPRTTKEAFKDGDYGTWWFPPEQRWQDKLFFVSCIVIWIGIGIYFWKTT